LPLDRRLLEEIGRIYASHSYTTPASSQQTTPTTETQDEESWWDRLKQSTPYQSALFALEAPRAGLGYLAGQLDPESYEAAYRENTEGFEPETSAEILQQSPSAGQVLLEKLVPGRPESAIGRGAKQAGVLASEILTDPLNAVPGALLGKGSKAARLAGRAARAGRYGRAAKLGATAAARTVASPAAAAAVYGPQIIPAVGQGAKQTYQSIQAGDSEAAWEAGTATALTATIGGLMGLGIRAELKGASPKKIKQRVDRAGEEAPVPETQVGQEQRIVAEQEQLAQQQAEMAAQQELEILPDDPNALDARLLEPEQAATIDAPEAEIPAEVPLPEVPTVRPELDQTPQVDPTVKAEELDKSAVEKGTEGEIKFQPDKPSLPEGFQVVERNGLFGVVDPGGKPVGGVADSPDAAIGKYQSIQAQKAETSRLSEEAARLREGAATPNKKPIEEALMDAYRADLPARGGLRSMPIATTQKRLIAEGYDPEEVKSALLRLNKDSKVAIAVHDVRGKIPKEELPLLPTREADKWPYYYWTPVEGEGAKLQVDKVTDTTSSKPLATEDIQKAFDTELPGTRVEQVDDRFVVDFPDDRRLVVERTGKIRVADYTTTDAYKSTYGEPLDSSTLAKGMTQEIGPEVLVRLADSANLETFIHEVKGHAALALGVMKPNEARDILNYYGRVLDKTEPNWRTRAEERFADALGKGQIPKVARGPLTRAWQFIKELVGKLNLEERTARAIEAIPERFKEAQAGKVTVSNRVKSGTAKPIPPRTVSERVLKPEEVGPEKQGPIGPLEESAKPGGKPDVTLNMNRLKELQEDVPDLPDEALQRWVEVAKDLQPSLDRATTMPMAHGALSDSARKAFEGKTLAQIEEAFKQRGWKPADVAYFSELHNRLLLQEENAHRALQLKSDVDTQTAYLRARQLSTAMTKFIGNRKTEAGRLLKAWHYAGKAAVDVPEEITGWQINSGNPAINRQLRQDVKDLRLNENQAEKLAEIYQKQGVVPYAHAYEDTFKHSLVDKLLEYRTKGLLTGPSTQIVNINSNFILAGVRALERSLLEPLVDASISTLKGKPRERFFHEGGARIAGFRNSLLGPGGAATQLFVDLKKIAALKRLEPKTSTMDPSRGKALGKAEISVWRPQAIKNSSGKGLGGVLNWGVKSLEAFDSFFKSLSAGQELYGQAYISLRKAGKTHAQAKAQMPTIVKELTDFAANPPKMPKGLSAEEATIWRQDQANTWQAKTLKQIERVALEDTFQAELGPLGKAGSQWLRHSALGRLIIPFYRTPVNILKESARRTPGLGLGFSMVEAHAALKSKDPQVIYKATENMAKSISGSILAGGAIWLGTELSDPDGPLEIVGAGPTDPRQQKIWRDLGYIPYSIRVGEKFYEYGRIEPFASTIGVVADMIDAEKRGDNKTAKDRANTLVKTAKENFLNKTFIMGLEGMFTALHEPERNLDYYVRNMLGSFVPTGVKAATRATDPTIRRQGKILDADWESLDFLKAATPGLSTDLEPAIDVAGNPIKRQFPFSPYKVSERKKGKEADFQRELLRVNYNPKVPRTIQDRKTAESVELTKRERDQLWEIRKATMADLAQRLLTDPTYTRLSTDALKKQHIANIIGRRERRFKKQIYERARQRARSS
jgi:hypothetical protein